MSYCSYNKQKDKSNNSDRWSGKCFILKVDFAKQNTEFENKYNYVYINKISIIVEALLNCLNWLADKAIFLILFVKHSDSLSSYSVTQLLPHVELCTYLEYLFLI